MSAKLSPPWVIYANKVKAMFEEDPEIRVVFDDEALKLSLYVDNGRKAEALSKLLPTEKEFGNVKIGISVIPSNDMETKLDLIQEAFYGNPALAFVWGCETPFGRFDYAVFEKKVVQFPMDDMQDINGNCSTLYQELAKELFGLDGNLFFCTDTDDPKLMKPLGEWP